MTNVDAEQKMYASSTGAIECARCGAEIETLERVAMLTRTWPGDPLDPWCVDCAHQLVHWAQVGAADEYQS